MKQEIDGLILRGFLERLMSAQTLEEMAAICQEACALYGCEHVQYGMLVPVSPTRPPRMVRFGNWSEEVCGYYFTQDFVGVDPVIESVLAGAPTLTWDEMDYASTPARRALHANLIDLGLRAGATCGVVGRYGEAACLSFSANRPAGRIAADLRHHLPVMHMLFAHAHQAVLRIEDLPGQGEQPGLTARELECLKWAAEGKTAAETALILHLSEHTVIRHLANAIRKLGAANRTHAVAKAILLRLFTP